MRIAVSGAAGFLGSWTVRALTARGHSVTAVVRPTTDLWRIAGLPGLEVQRRPNDEWAAVIRDGGFDCVISLDWEGVAAGSRDDAIQWANVDRQKSMIVSAASAGVRRFVGLGSQAEYGPRSERTDEESSTSPATTYGEAKVAALDQLRALATDLGIEWVWARVFSVYGPLDNPGTLLASIAGKFHRHERMDLSSGQQRWSYLYAADAGEALATLAVEPSAVGIVNVGHPLAPPLRQLVEEFASNFSTPAELNFAPAADPSSISNLDPATERLTGLSWQPQVATAEGLALTARWLQDQPVDEPWFSGRRIPAPRQNRPEV